MARSQKRLADIGFSAITIEGGLISPDQVVKVASTTPDQKAAAEYNCPKGVSLRDEITRYFQIGKAHWKSFASIEAPSQQQTETFVEELLTSAFGFELKKAGPRTWGDRKYAIAFEGSDGRVPVVVTAPLSPEEDGKSKDAFTVGRTQFGDGANGRIAKRSAALLLQDWLNANSDFYWGLAFAGDRVRLMRDNASFTRPAFIEADLGAIFRDDMFAEFTAWWLLTHASRYGKPGDPPSEAPLERWREAGMEAGTAARENLRGNVENALIAIGKGLLERNPDLRTKIDDNQLSMQSLFEQMLRTVYRLIFLAVAEDRDLLHSPNTARPIRQLYRENYGFAYLRERSAKRSSRDQHGDAWEGLTIVFRSLAQGQSELGLPALGGIFSADAAPDVDRATIPNRCLMEAIFNLGWMMDDGRRVRINWRDMATEEFGSVYEGLLELTPTRIDDGRSFDFVEDLKGNARKTSGSYYTPDSLVQTLLDSALNPVLEKAEAEGKDEGILELKVIDPACGSGHFLLGAARRMATRVAQIRDPDAPDYNAALRDVVGRCIHGVDRNPMAVELAKVALWIESVSPGQPLGFLDANIRCGDALLGVFDLEALEKGIPDDAYKPLTGDSKDAAKYWKAKNKDEKKGQGTFDFEGGSGAMPPKKLAANLSTIRRMSEDTVGQVEKKRAAFEAWRDDPARWQTKVACDFYTAAFLLPKVEIPENYQRGEVPTTADVWKRLGGGQVYGPMEGAAVDAAEAARAFHWPLAFPDVLIGKGGFDVVLGNPPWERIKLQEQEFFAGHEVADAPNAAARTKAIKKLAEAEECSGDRRLYDAFQTAKRQAEAISTFARVSGKEGGRYAYTGTGDVNTYALFAEHFLNLLGDSGRAGIIVPTGIATDATTARYFGHLVDEKRLARLFDFENSAPVFPGIHRSTKFCLLTLGKGVSEAEFSFFLTDPAQLEDSRRRFSLSPAEIARINPNTKTAPVFRTRKDAELTANIYGRIPVLIDEGRGPKPGEPGNPWGLSFATRLWHMAEDSEHFLDGPDDGLLPLLEAKMFHHFDSRFGSFAVEENEMSKADPSYEVTPRYWVRKSDIDMRLNESVGWRKPWLLGWRDITNVTNERTVISTVLPRTAVAHTSPLFFPMANTRLVAGLVGNLAALALDFVARQKVGGTHLTLGYLWQFPTLPPSAYSEVDLGFIVPRVLELTYTSHSMAPFARDLGYEGEPFRWDEGRRARLRAELDAWYALAYGLSRDELRYVLDPKDVMGEDYPSETFRVLQKNEIAKYGEYRTQRLVLAAYDKLVGEGMRARTEGYR